MNDDSLDSVLHIDLYNLEDVKFEGSKYVLTSPRSLEACSRLGVKPVELLYRPLSEFQEELLPQDVPLKTIYSLYDESEQIRQRKLRICREERNHIVNTEKKEASKEALKSRLKTLPSEDASKQLRLGKKGAVKKTASFHTRQRSRPLQRPESAKLQRELVSKKEKNPPYSKSSFKSRPASADNRKTQRCTSSVVKGTKVKYRSGSAPNTGVKLPVRDEKILKLMKDRREDEKKDLQVKKLAHQLWDDQKKREEALRTIAENKRRQLLAEENKIKNIRKLEEHEMLLMAQEEDLEYRKQKIKDSELISEINLMNQLRIKERKLSDKIRKETAKKVNQEKSLVMKEEEDEEMKKLLLAKKVSDLNTATEKRDVKIHQGTMKKFLENRHERELFEQRKKFLDLQDKQNKDLVRSSMETRLSQADFNLAQLLEQRNRQLEQNHREEQAKLARARLSHKKHESEMEAWRKGLMQHKKMVEGRAAEVMSQSVEMKALRARKNRTEKEEEQRKNFFKLQREDERWRRQLERSVMEKERKVDDILEEKERTVAQTRAMAQLSQTLRDDIKEKYVSDTFDKKVLEAELYAKLDREARSKSPALKNRSSIKIY